MGARGCGYQLRTPAPKKRQKTVEEIEKAGRKAHSTALDLRENENCKKAVDEH
jgi:hypothetical protein